MKESILYGIIVLLGLVAVNGVGLTTFWLGEHLHSQNAAPITVADQEKVEIDPPEFHLVVKEAAENLDCPTGVVAGPDWIASNRELILVTKLPDAGTPSLVSLSGSPVDYDCSDRAPASVKETY